MISPVIGVIFTETCAIIRLRGTTNHRRSPPLIPPRRLRRNASTGLWLLLFFSIEETLWIIQTMGQDDYLFLFDPPKDSDVFSRTIYYSRSPNFPELRSTSSSGPTSSTIIQSSLPDNRHAATLSKYTAGVFSSSSAVIDTVAPFLTEHVPDQVHIPDVRSSASADNERSKVYCYRHQPDLRCQRRAPQEATMAEIQKVLFSF